jgi:hypothetical protein
MQMSNEQVSGNNPRGDDKHAQYPGQHQDDKQRPVPGNPGGQSQHGKDDDDSQNKGRPDQQAPRPGSGSQGNNPGAGKSTSSPPNQKGGQQR